MTLLSSLVSSRPDASEALLDALGKTMLLRDAAMNQHGHRVRRYALALAVEAGITDSALLLALDAASVLHDVGKLAIPDHVLHKPGPLTADEYDLVKQHAVIGADILSAVQFPGPLALYVRHHHENWDGTGYPDRLRGADIPLGARVLAIADCYDALTSDRPYRRALPHGMAIAAILDRRGTAYDPHITDVFMRTILRLQEGRPRSRASLLSMETPAVWLHQAGVR